MVETKKEEGHQERIQRTIFAPLGTFCVRVCVCEGGGGGVHHLPFCFVQIKWACKLWITKKKFAKLTVLAS